MILVHLQSKPFIITVIQVCAPTTDAEEAKVEQFHEDLLELMQKPTNQTNKNSFSSQEAKWLSTEALQIAEERREVKGKGNDKDILNAENSTGDKKALE